MFFSIEFSKIFKRKFNYLFGLIVLAIGALLTYEISSIATFYDISKMDVYFGIILKSILVLVIFLMGINFIYSYREDYETNVIKLLKISKKETNKLLSSLLATTIYFLIYYIFCLVGAFIVLYLRERTIVTNIFDIMIVDKKIVAYILLLIAFIIFINLIFLLILTMFNNTNLAISISLLYFIGSKPLATFVETKFNNSYIVGTINIFNETLSKLNYNITLNDIIWRYLGINILILVIILSIIKIVKR